MEGDVMSSNVEVLHVSRREGGEVKKVVLSVDCKIYEFTKDISGKVVNVFQEDGYVPSFLKKDAYARACAIFNEKKDKQKIYAR